MAVAMAGLLGAIWAGLMRMGWAMPAASPRLPLDHGPLMVSGFLGTLIALERAVAIGRADAYLAPLLAGLGTVALLAGVPYPVAQALISLAALALVWNFAVILKRQTALFTVTMTIGSAAWLVGNLLWLARVPIPLLVAWWAGFLVLTIAGERLELSRLSPLGSRGRGLFVVVTAAYLAGLVLTSLNPVIGGRVTGLALVALALWLYRYDVARRTVRLGGLTRFIALALLSGYVWLALSGLFEFLFAAAPGVFHYDAILHSLFLGFVFSMIFGHAPIIFPAVTGRPVGFYKIFYAHLALLHLSLAMRVAGDLAIFYPVYQWGGMLNAVALLLFAANTGIAVARSSRPRVLRPVPSRRRAGAVSGA